MRINLNANHAFNAHFQADKLAPKKNQESTSSSNTQPVNTPLQSEKQSLTVAKMEDIYFSRIYASVDKNFDEQVTQEEYSEALIANGAIKANAEDLFKMLNKDNDSFLSMDEFKAGLKNPFGEGYSQKIAEIREQIKAGKPIASIEGSLLGADGQTIASDQILRSLITTFSGNV